MGRKPSFGKQSLKKRLWSPEEDELLINYINQHGHGTWRSLPQNAGLQRDGKCCRNRWTNQLAGGMGRTPCCTQQGLKKVAWSPDEDQILINYINEHGHGNWDSLAKNVGLQGLQRSGESCRLRWRNYLAREMGRRPCYDKQGLKKGAWSSEEDQLLINYINEHGHRNWRSLPKNAGLQRNENSCRFRWTYYLSPGIKRDPSTPEEENLVIQSHKIIGNRFYITPSTHHMAQWESASLEAEARLSSESLIYNPHSSSSFYSDVFLPLWETEVGESFQKVAEKENTEKSTWQSPVSETLSSTKCASSSVLTQRNEDVEVKEDSKSHIQLLNARSNSSCSDLVANSSVSELQLLLNFSENNDMSFLENDICDFFN